jgi:hypothetical protein
MVVALRATIRLERGDPAGADRDSGRAVVLARSSDAQAQAAAFPAAAAIALARGRRDEADALATEALALGPVLLPALTTGFPNLAQIAWLFRDLGREADLAAVLDATPIPSPWIDAARAILAGDDTAAERIIVAIGDRTSASHARARATAA